MSNNAILNNPTVKLYTARANEAELNGQPVLAQLWRSLLNAYLKAGSL